MLHAPRALGNVGTAPDRCFSEQTLPNLGLPRSGWLATRKLFYSLTRSPRSMFHKPDVFGDFYSSDAQPTGFTDKMPLLSLAAATNWRLALNSVQPRFISNLNSSSGTRLGSAVTYRDYDISTFCFRIIFLIHTSTHILFSPLLLPKHAGREIFDRSIFSFLYYLLESSRVLFQRHSINVFRALNQPVL